MAPAKSSRLPRRAAWSSSGVAASAATRPTPWLTLLAISSPRDCGRSVGTSQACGPRRVETSRRGPQTVAQFLPHERHVAVQVRDRADVPLLAERDAPWVAADVDRRGQVVRLQVEHLYETLARYPDVGLHVVRSHTNAEGATGELDVGRNHAAGQVDLVEKAILVPHVQHLAALGHSQVLGRSPDRER